MKRKSVGQIIEASKRVSNAIINALVVFFFLELRISLMTFFLHFLSPFERQKNALKSTLSNVRSGASKSAFLRPVVLGAWCTREVEKGGGGGQSGGWHGTRCVFLSLSRVVVVVIVVVVVVVDDYSR